MKLVLLNISITGVHAFEMFGINIFSANRNQMSKAILQHEAEKLPYANPSTDLYETNHPFTGARMFVEYTVDDELESMVFQFDSGSPFTEVLKYKTLRQRLIETYGLPEITHSDKRINDFEEELRWSKDGINIHLVNYKWYAAWRIHVTHRLCFYRVAIGLKQKSKQ